MTCPCSMQRWKPKENRDVDDLDMKWIRLARRVNDGNVEVLRWW